MATSGCVEVEQGKVEILLVEAFRDCAPMLQDPWGSGRDWIFPRVLGRARLATLHETADAAFRGYQMGHPNRPSNPWRKVIEVRVLFHGLDLCDIDIARADQILQDLEAGLTSLDSELRRVEQKGGQGVLLRSSCGGIAIVLLEKAFESCVEFGRIVEFDPDQLVP